MDSRFSMLPIAVLSDRRLTYRQLVVFAALCSFRQGAEDYSICAGRDEISARCGLHRSAISSATTELENLGWITKTGHGGRSLKSEYRITIPETVAEHATVTHHATVTEGETVTHHVSKTVAHHATSLYRTDKYTEGCAVKAKSVDPEGFAECWSLYPKREGGNSRADALKAYRARVKAGASPDELLAGVKRYAGFCAAKGRVGTSYVFQASTFFGPAEHWKEDWEIARPSPGSAPSSSVFAGAI